MNFSGYCVSNLHLIVTVVTTGKLKTCERVGGIKNEVNEK
jgi:hypothetical protein